MEGFSRSRTSLIDWPIAIKHRHFLTKVSLDGLASILLAVCVSKFMNGSADSTNGTSDVEI